MALTPTVASPTPASGLRRWPAAVVDGSQHASPRSAVVAPTGHFSDNDDEDDFAIPPSLTIDGDDWDAYVGEASYDTAPATMRRRASDGTATAGAAAPPSVSGLTAIVDGELYLGSQRDAWDAEACARLGIGAYLCVAKEAGLPPHAAVGAGGSPGLHLPLVDGAGERLEEWIPAAMEFIEAQVGAGRRVALFCQAGRSRSVSLAVAYVQRRLGLADSEAALAHVSSRYGRADPNFFFLQQLAECSARSTSGRVGLGS